MKLIYFFTLSILLLHTALGWASRGRGRNSRSRRDNDWRNRGRNDGDRNGGRSYYDYRYNDDDEGGNDGGNDGNDNGNGGNDGGDNNGGEQGDDEPAKMNITAYIYVDNYFRFYVNGELIVNDPIEFTPHNGIYTEFEINVDDTNVYAFEARDFGFEKSGLEYENRCIGDGGLKAIFSNGIVTNSEWKCVTTFRGPLNPEGCFNGTDSGMNDDRFNGGICKQWNYYTDSASDDNCETEFTYYPNNWFTTTYDDSDWPNAFEYTDDVVGFGTAPTQETCSQWGLNFGDDLCLSPRDFDFGNGTFIWTDDLNFNNRILCRYTQN